MKEKSSKYGAYILKTAVAAFFCTGLLVNCARVGTITGGPKDTLPPVVVEMKPGMYARNFNQRSIFVEFDEYVQLKDLQKEFYTSPAMKRKPTATIKGRGVRIDIPDYDSLIPNTTYALNFGSAIVDNNEGNPLHSFRYVFSTGDQIDSLVMSGYTADAFKGDSVSKTFIYFFDAALDSIPAYDSVVFNNLPEAIGRAQNNGIFIAENLKAKEYRIYAVQDENGNQQYDAGVDKIGFLDSMYNPAAMPDFDAWSDTLRGYMVADPQLYFRMFLDQRPARQTLISATRPQQHKLMFVFGAPYPQIQSLTFENIDTTGIITEYLKPTRDSVALWLNIPTESIPDTIKGELTYLRHDSVNVLVPHTQKLNLGWKKFESREQERERLRREKEIEKMVAEGQEAPKEKSPFKYTLSGTTVNPERNMTLSVDYPLTAIDSAAVTLTRGEDGEAVRMRWVQDTAQLRQWTLTAEWEPGTKYELTIPPGALVNIAGERNDSIVQSLEVMDPDKYATMIVDITGKTPQSEYVLQLVNETGKPINEIAHAKTGTYTFRYVEPGKVKLMVIEDMNGNGKWDVGNLVQRLQPERVETFMPEPGNPLIELKAGWETTQTVDMNELFAPVSMERIRETLRQQEQVLLQKIREERAKKRGEPQQQQSGGSAMDVMRNSGLNLPGF